MKDGELALSTQEPLQLREDGALYLSIRLIQREDGMIQNIKEQEVYLGQWADHPPSRWEAYLQGLARSATQIALSLGGLDALMPFDFFMYAQTLQDPSIISADDFTARLSDPKQLAQWNQELRDGEWLEYLEPCGLQDHLAGVKALMRPSLRLRLEPHEELDDESSLVGETRFGGEPDLPPGESWPEAEGEPMIFVAQLALADLNAYEAARELPEDGLLSFFYSPFGRQEQVLDNPVKVFHFASTVTLQRRSPPKRGEALTAYQISTEPEEGMPAVESMYHYEAFLPKERLQRYYQALALQDGSNPPISYYALSALIQARNNIDPERPTHRLLGHPDSIQGDPYLDVEMSKHGWHDWKEGSDEAMRARERALQWRLLLQVDAYQDGELLLNQDGGYFYFWIPADALAAHDWSRVQGCLQCH
jgi:hypothetical protein